jgi:DNA-3-methyladenine glycosylase
VASIVTASFFEHDARAVAKDLLGKYLVRRVNGKTSAYKIVETEAYLGSEDLASHARFGITKRNAVMHGPGGHWYVYLTYGMHYMLNIVTGPAGKPQAVLIRAVEGINGPARLTKALKIDKRLNGKPATKASGAWIEDRGEKVNPRHIKRTPRIGIDYAGEWAKKPFRFVLTSASRPRPSPKRRSF